MSGFPHQICPPVVQRASSELACGWSLHARTNRKCTLSEMRMDCVSGDVSEPPVQVEYAGTFSHRTGCLRVLDEIRNFQQMGVYDVVPHPEG